MGTLTSLLNPNTFFYYFLLIRFFLIGTVFFISFNISLNKPLLLLVLLLEGYVISISGEALVVVLTQSPTSPFGNKKLLTGNLSQESFDFIPLYKRLTD